MADKEKKSGFMDYIKAFKWIAILFAIFYFWNEIKQIFGIETNKKGNSVDDSLIDEYLKEYDGSAKDDAKIRLQTVADMLHEAMSGSGTDERSIYQLFHDKNVQELNIINQMFGVREGKSLSVWLQSELDDTEKRFVSKYLEGSNIQL